VLTENEVFLRVPRWKFQPMRSLPACQCRRVSRDTRAATPIACALQANCAILRDGTWKVINPIVELVVPPRVPMRTVVGSLW
jgi:hypothetical protein